MSDEHRKRLIAEGLQRHLDETREGLLDFITEVALTLKWMEQWAASLALEAEDPAPSDGQFQKVMEHRIDEIDKRIKAFQGRMAGTANYVLMGDLAQEIRREWPE